MNQADEATIARIAELVEAKQVNAARALVTAYHLGELAGKLEMARISHPVFDSALDIMSGKVTNG